MILTTHALTGAVIGKNLESIWLIIISALALHYILDTFRHGEYLDKKSGIKDTWWKVSLDIAIGLGIVNLIIFFQDLDPAKILFIFLGVFFSMLPDLFTLLFWVFKIKPLENLYRLHVWVHSYPPFSKERAWTFRNMANDLLFSSIAIALLFFF